MNNIDIVDMDILKDEEHSLIKKTIRKNLC